MSKNVLYITHKEELCGVQQFGYQIGKSLRKSKKYNILYLECSSQSELNKLVTAHQPISIIYNYHPLTLDWLNYKVTSKYDVPQLGMIHEVTQKVADRSNNLIFDYHIAADPTLILKNSLVYNTGRLLLNSNSEIKDNVIPVIGSFGYATPNKRFELLVQKVCDEFKVAVIKLNLPFSRFVDPDGNIARRIIINCQQIISKYKGISLVYSHNYLSDAQLLMFLSSNTLNAFFYKEDGSFLKRGISSVIDFALSVKVPIAISENTGMFRHIENAEPSIIYSENNTLKNIIKNGTKPLEKFYKEWTEENLIWDYERIIDDVLNRFNSKKTSLLQKTIKAIIRKVPYSHRIPYPYNKILYSWAYAINDYKDNSIIYDKTIKYQPANISKEELKYNRILNDDARKLYANSIKQLHKVIPKWMERKIERANIQQGFVLDTVVRLSRDIPIPKIISIGCFEDTAWGALNILGYNVEGIDPVLNYDLDTFLTKPSTQVNYYDIVFSTSVIEHIEDDLTFLKNMCLLTKKGGYIILTCDFKKGYQVGDPKPSEDHRLYTKEHILNNLLAKIKDCDLIDPPEWDRSMPDFKYCNYIYTFAAIVLKKTK